MERPSKRILIRQGIILFFLGLIGILSSLPLIPQLLVLQQEMPSISIYAIQLFSLIQASIILAGMVLLGLFFAHRVNLHSPLVHAIAGSENVLRVLRNITPLALFGGVFGGICILIFSATFSHLLPIEFLESGQVFSPPWYTRILYGGITEEIFVRWGLMSFLVWCCFRITQKRSTDIRPHNYIVAILVSALIFGAGHLPAVYLLSSVITFPLTVYIIFGNAIFGVIAGYLYWRRGLECAIVAHMIAHMTILAGEALV